MRVLCLLFITTVFSFKSFCQSIYKMQYAVTDSIDTKNYDALLVLQQDGKGIMRIKTAADAEGKFNLFEQKIQEDPDAYEAGIPDSILYLGSELKPVRRARIRPRAVNVLFAFKEDQFQPVKLTTNAGENTITELLKADLVMNTELKENLLLDYYSKSDSIYINLFAKLSQRALTPQEKSIKMHLLLVANTNDSALKEAAAIDLNKAETLFSDLADFLGIKSNIHKVYGNDFSKSNVLKAMDRLRPKPNDIVIFYYSGHGFRTKNKPSPYPMFDLRGKKGQNYLTESLSIDSIYSLIRKKGARMNLIIGDCCNWNPDIPLPYATKPIPESRASEVPWDEEKCRQLFLNPIPITIMAAAADKNQLAVSNPIIGSFFLHHFKQMLQTQLSTTNKDYFSWYQILDETRTNTYRRSRTTYCSDYRVPQNICRQTPKFQIE